MQVFEVFEYNLNHIKFKDNKGFFDGILKELNVEYSDIAFCFETDYSGSVCDKAIKHFPVLKEYKQYLEASERWTGSPPEYRLCSIRTDCDGRILPYAQKNHIDAFCGLLKKIPNTINFGFMGVILDNIDWYGSDSQTPMVSSCLQEGVYSNFRFERHFSNSIRFFKEYDYGNKLNSVKLMIERREENGALCSYPAAFTRMLEILGKPKYQYLKCQFNDAEKEKWEESAQNVVEIIRQDRKEIDSCAAAIESSLDKMGYLLDSVTPVAGFSPKSTFVKGAKKKGYQNLSCRNGCYQYAKRNKSNHTFVVEIMNISFSSFFEGSIYAQGYNFKHVLYTANQVAIKDATYAEDYADKMFEMASEMEKKYTNLLESVYGKTPQWFADSGNHKQF